MQFDADIRSSEGGARRETPARRLQCGHSGGKASSSLALLSLLGAKAASFILSPELLDRNIEMVAMRKERRQGDSSDGFGRDA